METTGGWQTAEAAVMAECDDRTGRDCGGGDGRDTRAHTATTCSTQKAQQRIFLQTSRREVDVMSAAKSVGSKIRAHCSVSTSKISRRRKKPTRTAPRTTRVSTLAASSSMPSHTAPRSSASSRTPLGAPRVMPHLEPPWRKV